jgi:hypothetical protein
MAKKAFRHRVIVNGVVTYESDDASLCWTYINRLPEFPQLPEDSVTLQFRYRGSTPIGKCFVYAGNEKQALVATVQKLYGKDALLILATPEPDGVRRWRFIGRMAKLNKQPNIVKGGESDPVMTVLPEWIHINIREL